jgi:hypothetical protein
MCHAARREEMENGKWKMKKEDEPMMDPFNFQFSIFNFPHVLKMTRLLTTDY